MMKRTVTLTILLFTLSCVSAVEAGGRFKFSGASANSARGTTAVRSGAMVGQYGSASSSGSFQRNVDGTYSGGRTTSAQIEDIGSYEGSTTYQNGQLSHQGTCYNASG